MADVVSPRTRSMMMAGIRGTNTRPELFLRKALHCRGFRYRLHVATMPGKPDMVFPGRRAVIFVHGCFWHGHDCHLFKWPSTRVEFWRAKITGNRQRDTANHAALSLAGWRILSVWECAIKGRLRLPEDALVQTVVVWLETGINDLELRGG